MRQQLIASHHTLSGAPTRGLPRFSFEERVAAAATAGFDGIGMHYLEYAHLRTQGRSDEDLRAILDRHGMRVLEIEFLAGWARDDASPRTAEAERWLLAMADAFGARHVNVGDMSDAAPLPPLEVVAPRFAGLCDRAADHELLVAIEFLPFGGIPDAATAWHIAEAANRPNGGVLIDAWHHFRGANDPALLSVVPADRVFVVQLDDADREQVGTLMEDTVLRRRLPGEGDFDLVGMLQLLARRGVRAPVSVEVISTEQQQWPVDEAARRAFETTSGVLAAAGWGSAAG